MQERSEIQLRLALPAAEDVQPIREDQWNGPPKGIAEPPAGALLRRKAKSAFLVAVLLTVLLGFLSWRTEEQASQSLELVVHTHEVMTSLEAALQHLIEVETGGRGFAITGQQLFRESYERAKSSIDGDVRALRLLTRDNVPQQKRLDLLAEQARASIDAASKLVALRVRTRAVLTGAEPEAGRGLTDAVRATISTLEAEEQQLLTGRTQAARAAQRFTSLATTAAAFFGVIFLSAAGIAVSREIGVSAKARAQVDALNTDLEQRISQRTAALRESEGRLAGVIQSAMDSIITVDDEQRIVLFNSAAEKMFGCSGAEALEQPIARFLPEHFLEAQTEQIRKLGESGDTSSIAIRAIRANGQEFQSEASISGIETAGKKMFTVILRDVTERKQAEEIRERLAAVVDSSDDAIISKTLTGVITAWNKGAEKIFGYSSAEALGQSMLMLLPPDRVAEESDILGHIRSGKSVEHFETARVRKDGKRIDVSVTISPIKDDTGEIVGASKVARDITGRKLAEKALREKEQLLSESQRIANVGSWTYDLSDREGKLVWSEESYRIYGVPPDTFVPTVESLLYLLVPDDRPAMDCGLHSRGEARRS